jgi:protein-export membrane protein, SecD/SecF family
LSSYHEAGGKFVVQRRVMVSGEMLTDARAAFDQNGMPSVSFSLTPEGGKRFGRVTGNNIGRPFAIVLDGKVVSAPTIQSQIFSSGQITGRFTVQETKDLALLLRAGALPAPLTVMEERSVGPGLGQDSIDSGKTASIIGLILVIVFMIFTYAIFGFLANLALFFNVILIMAALSILQATLTLPGIAGIVLTMGMAVDANVLIFERIREELRSQKTVLVSVESGYKRAIGTIVDANLTTLIAAACLYGLGSGPIKGFAITLSIGIIPSMFTAVM